MRAHPAGKLGEGATAVSGAELCERQFQSTPPARGRLEKILLRLKKTAISIHAPREGGRLPSEYPGSGANDISIHAPARGGDHGGAPSDPDGMHFNPRPREGGDDVESLAQYKASLFQSTPPRGGATANIFTRYSPAFISIHAPARGGDDVESLAQYKASLFQSTPPRGGATRRTS